MTQDAKKLSLCLFLLQSPKMETIQNTLTADQRLLLKGLESHPKLMPRFLSILSLAEEPDRDGTIRCADEVEALLIDEVRKLGREGMESWASKIDGLLGEQSKKDDPSVKLREKNAKMVEYLWLD